jgi:hypothetical protein
MSRASPPSVTRLACAVVAIAIAAACGEAGENRNATPPPAAAAEAPSAEIAARRVSAVETKLVPKRAVIGSDPDPTAPTLIFQAREAPARLLGWLRATANGADFVLESEMQEGAAHVLSGRVRATGEAFTVRIAPGATGGTTGMVMVTAR